MRTFPHHDGGCICWKIEWRSSTWLVNALLSTFQRVVEENISKQVRSPDLSQNTQTRPKHWLLTHEFRTHSKWFNTLFGMISMRCLLQRLLWDNWCLIRSMFQVTLEYNFRPVLTGRKNHFSHPQNLKHWVMGVGIFPPKKPDSDPNGENPELGRNYSKFRPGLKLLARPSVPPKFRIRTRPKSPTCVWQQPTFRWTRVDVQLLVQLGFTGRIELAGGQEKVVYVCMWNVKSKRKRFRRLVAGHQVQLYQHVAIRQLQRLYDLLNNSVYLVMSFY